MVPTIYPCSGIWKTHRFTDYVLKGARSTCVRCGEPKPIKKPAPIAVKDQPSVREEG